jgi:HSP20 family molecular chaperone IbpA
MRCGDAPTARPDIRKFKENTMASLQIYDPFADAGFDDLFRGFFRPVRADKSAPLAIKMDVKETDQGYAVNAEIPGVKKEDIQVAIEGNDRRRSKAGYRAEGWRTRAADRALLRQRLSQLRASRRARRSGERSEVRQRRA